MAKVVRHEAWPQGAERVAGGSTREDLAGESSRNSMDFPEKQGKIRLQRKNQPPGWKTSGLLQMVMGEWASRGGGPRLDKERHRGCYAVISQRHRTLLPEKILAENTIKSRKIMKKIPLCAQETYVHEKTCTWLFTVVLFIMAKKWIRPKCLAAEEWVNKM